MRTAFRHDVCLHPDAPESCDQIVSAHTIQRAGILERLVDEGRHVLGFDPTSRDSDGGMQLRRFGWREASTFTGFCAKHDAATFRPLETQPFSGTKEQCFLLAYRALCHEIYQKRGSLRAQPVLRRVGDQGLPDDLQARLQHGYRVMEAGTRRGLGYFEELKASMDAELLAADRSRWAQRVVRFLGEIAVATSGVVSPNRDLAGNELQVLHDPTRREQQPLFCSVVSTEHGGALVFSWLHGHSAPQLFLESVLAQGDRAPDLILQFFFAHISNTFFSPSWWDSLSVDQRRHIAALAGITTPYTTQLRYVDLQAAPWRIESIDA